VDTGVICSLYTLDAHSQKAANFFGTLQFPIYFTWLHQLELHSALRLRVFRNEITPFQREEAFRLYLSDVQSNMFLRKMPDMDLVHQEAERLSATFSENIGNRSLDILHVAMADVLGAETFVSFDPRQTRPATEAGFLTQT
jgi:predicted nucleic acid-binding protein